MQNTAPVESTKTEETLTVADDQESPLHLEPSFWFSLLAVILSGLSYRRTGAIARNSKFDKHFGDDIRAKSRKLETTLKELNAFIYPSQKTVAEQKLEIPPVIDKIDIANHALASLLRELDQSDKVAGKTWQSDYERESSKAFSIFEQIAHLANSQDVLFSRTVLQARDGIQTAIDKMRKKLEKASYD